MLLSTVVLVSLSAVLVGAADTVDVSNSFAKQRHSIDVKGKKELGKHTTVTIHDGEGDVGDEEGIFELEVSGGHRIHGIIYFYEINTERNDTQVYCQNFGFGTLCMNTFFS